jgi:uncharacterized Zn finger protein
MLPLLREQIVKMDCDRCKLTTEHYLLDYGYRPVLCRCLRCGHVTTNPGSFPVGHEPYPIDDRKPIYVA